MNKSDSIANLAAALAKAQGEIRGATRDAQNPHFKHNYADLSSIWDACRDALSRNEIAVTQLPSADGAVVRVETVMMHSSGEWISSELAVTARDGSPQSVGSALTYCRRYGLASVVGVAPVGDDDDAGAAQPKGRATRQAERNAQPVAPDPNAQVKNKARAMAQHGHVTQQDKGYEVTDVETGDVHSVTRNDAKFIVCECDGFTEGFERNEGFQCSHILAVKMYVESQKKRATEEVTARDVFK